MTIEKFTSLFDQPPDHPPVPATRRLGQFSRQFEPPRHQPFLELIVAQLEQRLRLTAHLGPPTPLHIHSWVNAPACMDYNGTRLVYRPRYRSIIASRDTGILCVLGPVKATINLALTYIIGPKHSS